MTLFLLGIEIEGCRCFTRLARHEQIECSKKLEFSSFFVMNVNNTTVWYSPRNGELVFLDHGTESQRLYHSYWS
jgi:hypothetical protein